MSHNIKERENKPPYYHDIMEGSEVRDLQMPREGSVRPGRGRHWGGPWLKKKIPSL